MGTRYFTNGRVFDGISLRDCACIALHADGAFELRTMPPKDARTTDLTGDILSPGFTDLQVNGGGGVMVGAGADLNAVAAAHWALGTTRFLPTLITDTAEATRAVIDAVAQTALPNVAGLHLEGPHLDPAKAGAHDPALIRPMTEVDLALYCDAAKRLPKLKITLAPENATREQVRDLADAGILVALGHSNCSYEVACAYFDAGARAVTHLWNAMSPLTSRAPGLVGAALDRGIPAGLIADHKHVHPATLRSSWQSMTYLVTDAMACAGTDQTEFQLGDRRILRREGRLTLEDGTLAGADLDMLGAVRGAVAVGISLEEALAAAITRPSALMGLDTSRATVRIAADLSACAPLDAFNDL